jgi:hypothetical protein
MIIALKKKFYIDLGIDEKTAKKLCGNPGGIWYDFKAIIYLCFPFVFIALFIFDVIDLKSFLLLFLIWFVGDLVCNFLHHILKNIQFSSVGIIKLQEITNEKIDTIIEQLRKSDN